MQGFQSTLVSADTPVSDVIRVINESSKQIALVVDSNRKLLGTVTDGDIRRALLKGLPIETSAEKVMNKKPYTARPDFNSDDLLQLMTDKKLRQMPIIDEAGVVVGLEVLENLLNPEVRENWVVLMAGGLGRRMSPLTDDTPKPLLKVGNKPVLETILQQFIRHGFKNFFISVNYRAEMIEEYFGDGSRWGVKIEYLREKEKMGTAGALTLLPRKPSMPLFLMNGDLLSKVNLHQLLEFHQEHSAALTMAVREHDFQVPYGVVKLDKHQVRGIDEKPVQKFFVNAGIYVLEPSILPLVVQGRAFDLPELVQAVLDRNLEAAAFPLREYWVDIGHRHDYDRANGEYAGEFE